MKVFTVSAIERSIWSSIVILMRPMELYSVSLSQRWLCSVPVVKRRVIDLENKTNTLFLTHVGWLSHHYKQNKGAIVSNNGIVLKISPLMGSNEYIIGHKQWRQPLTLSDDTHHSKWVYSRTRQVKFIQVIVYLTHTHFHLNQPK